MRGVQQTFTQEPLSQTDIAVTLAQIRPAAKSGKKSSENGTRVHIHYEAIGEQTEKDRQEALRAVELGLPPDRYTGRVSRVWKSKAGDLIVTLFVELERNHLWRSFNMTKGKVFQFVILGN